MDRWKGMPQMRYRDRKGAWVSVLFFMLLGVASSLLALDEDARQTPPRTSTGEGRQPTHLAIAKQEPQRSAASSDVAHSSVFDGRRAKELRERMREVHDDQARAKAILHFAQGMYEQISRNIQDYSCVMVRRERVNGRLFGYEYFRAKVRHQQSTGGQVTTPFSVFLEFLQPDRVKGREVIYVTGASQGDLIVRRGGRRSPNMTIQLDPESPVAMERNRYPITEIGIKNLLGRLIGALEAELERGGIQVRIYENAKLENRKCIHIQLRHKEKRPDDRFWKAIVFVDEQLSLPVYFASYDWPHEEGGKPRILEEYAYTQLELNVGLKDIDFDPKNPEYHFQNRTKKLSDTSTSDPSDDSGRSSIDQPNDDSKNGAAGSDIPATPTPPSGDPKKNPAAHQ